jgi:hypothetical protein
MFKSGVTEAIKKRSAKVKNPWPFKKIDIRIVPTQWMREQYKDAYGDYYTDEKGTLHIRSREYENPDHAFGCIIHELIEAWRCYKKGITLESIEKFDADHADHDDPGRLPEAPYHLEHCRSMEIERLMCYQDGIPWDEYDKAEPLP